MSLIKNDIERLERLPAESNHNNHLNWKLTFSEWENKKDLEWVHFKMEENKRDLIENYKITNEIDEVDLTFELTFEFKLPFEFE